MQENRLICWNCGITLKRKFCDSCERPYDMQLTKGDIAFLAKKMVTENDVFDGRRLSKTDREEIAKGLGKNIILVTKGCKKEGHHLQWRSGGHCAPCNPHNDVVWSGPYSQPGYVYIDGSISTKLIKIGRTKSPDKRNNSLNTQGWAYALASDWKMLYCVYAENHGAIEQKTKSKLAEHQILIDYPKGDKIQEAREVFKCSYTIAKAALDIALENSTHSPAPTLISNLSDYEFPELMMAAEK